MTTTVLATSAARPGPSLGQILGLAVAALGLSTTSGWLLQLPILFELHHGLVPMVFNTGLSFLLTGLALALPSRHGGRWATLRTFMAATVVGLCGLTLIELVLDRGLLGIDLVSLHTWYDYGNTRPGRMAPNTALGFLVAASAILVGDRVSSRALGLAEVTLTFLLLIIGLTGLIGYLLAPELLFNWARSARMALHTATGMVLMSLALWLSWLRSDWYAGETYFREDGKIRLLSGALLVIVTTAAALTGFVLQQDGTRRSLEDRLSTVIKARGPWLAIVVDDVRLQAQQALALLSPAHPEPGALDKSAEGFAAQGWQRVVLQQADGLPSAVLGPTATQPGFVAPVDETGQVALVWDQGLRLRVTLALDSGARLVMERPAPRLEQALFATNGLGDSGEIAVCRLAQPGQMLCLPTRWQRQPFSLSMRPAGKTPLPMQLALAGQRGVVQSVDYRQQNVIAAYGQLAPGLGFVAKQDAAETYAPIRRALLIGAPLVAVVAMAGALLMLWQLSPLVARMRAAETLAADAAARVKAIVDSAGDGIVTVNETGVIESANRAAGQIFGIDPSQLRGRTFAGLLDGAVDADKMLARARHPERALLLPAFEVEGLRHDGARFPLECTISPVMLHGQTLSVVMLRDSSIRKELEVRLSHLAQYDQLTGLPNRALFMDRFATAALRAGRARRAMAVLFLDLDGFKAINDGFGHAEGDAVLVQTARRLNLAVRKSDTVARLGGDEFTIILEQLSQPEADVLAVADKIVQLMREPFVVQGRPCRVTVSIGAALHLGGDQLPDTATLLSRADDAMYEAKRAGKDAYRLSV